MSQLSESRTPAVTSPQTHADDHNEVHRLHNLLDRGIVVLVAAPGTTQTYSGDITNMTYGESLVPGDLVYMKSDGSAWKADADSITTAPVIGMAMETGSSGSRIVLLRGFYRDDSRYNFTIGGSSGTVYLSTTAGVETQTQPSGVDDVIQVIGVAIHADRIYFNPSPDILTHI